MFKFYTDLKHFKWWSPKLYEVLLATAKKEHRNELFEEIFEKMMQYNPSLKSLQIAHVYFQEKGDERRVEEVLQQISILESNKTTNPDKHFDEALARVVGVEVSS